MKKISVTAAALVAMLAFVPFASAGVKSCSVDAVADGFCRASTNVVVAFDAPAADFTDWQNAVAALNNYSTEITCLNTRQFEPLSNGAASLVLAAAGVASGDCAAGQVGQAVANPQSKADFAFAVTVAKQQNMVIDWKFQAAQQQAAGPENVPTPDVGGAP